MESASSRLNRRQFAWAFYDFANSAFSTTVMAGFFPLFFKQYWSADINPQLSSLYLGSANSIAGFVVALLAPLMGTIADHTNKRRFFLILFTMFSIASTFSFAFVPKNGWQMAATLFTLASIGYSAAITFYDAELTFVAPKNLMHRVSTLGYSLGYLGGGVLFAINVYMYLNPQFFGLTDGVQAIKVSFITVAVWWLLFSLPTFLLVKDLGDEKQTPLKEAFYKSLTTLKVTFVEAKRNRQIFLFLLAYWLYIDGVGTIIRMAVDYGISLGFQPADLIKTLLITQFVGFPATFFFGYLADKIGAKKSIYLCLAVYIFISIWGYWIDGWRDFMVLAVVIGLVQGGIQSLSRSYFAKMIPAENSGEYFGLFNMVGKFAAILGPIMMGLVAHLTGSTRVSIFSITALFVAGGMLFSFVKPEKKSVKA